IGELGTTLSAGQTQRLLLARAFYKEPDILLLDEATAHLDEKNERYVLESIHQLNCIKILVTHNPDRIWFAHKTLLLVPFPFHGKS
ncbi:MAG TPA: ATP-binding cassette domain-containing protein, partial [Coxiellaceae bacterium]|nr:ATP-binding cassette domain-containing protein [Coxiellaceae bacterium]